MKTTSKRFKYVILTTTVYLVLFFGICRPAVGVIAQCENYPKQKANGVAFVIFVAVVGFIAYSLYKCAKKNIDKQPPVPPEEGSMSMMFTLKSGSNTMDVPTNFWGSPNDFTSVTNCMKGLAGSSSNAFIEYVNWKNDDGTSNTTYRDREGYLYDSWFSGTLPVKTSTNGTDWSQTYTVTGWVSPNAILSVYYKNGVEIARNYQISRDQDVYGDPNYNAISNASMVNIPFVNKTNRMELLMTVPH